MITFSTTWARENPSHNQLNEHTPIAESISLNDTAKLLGLKFYYQKPHNKVILSNQHHCLQFEIHKRDFKVNGISISLSSPVQLKNSLLYISQSDFHKTITPLIIPQKLHRPKKEYTIVLDPGHGGIDHGTENKHFNILEKNLTLDVALKLKRKLEQKNYTVILTRAKDETLKLDRRPQIANNSQADLFISIHFNSAACTDAQGIETYTLTLQGHTSTNDASKHSPEKSSLPGNKNDIPNLLLAHTLHKELLTNLNVRDRSIRRARFIVLKTLNCPGTLLELGYLSNYNEAKNILSNAYREKIAEAISKSIDNYIYSYKMQ